MNNTINNPVGIDVVIQDIQTTLHDELGSLWVNDLDVHGRIYKNIASDGSGLLPQWYIGNGEYKDVYYNDQYSGVIIFIDGDNHTTEDELVYSTDVKVVFMLDLSRVLPSETDRADAIVQNDVIEILRNNANNRYQITSVLKGISNVFRGFNTNHIKLSDIQPYHVFAVDLDLTYYLTDKCE